MSDERDEAVKALGYRDQMHLHIGRIVRNAASLEGEAMVLITTLVDSNTPIKVRPLVQGRRLSELIDTLSQVMPDYPEKPNLIKAMRAVNAHRDRLAHSTMTVDFNDLDEGPDLNRHWIERQGRTASSTHRLDASEFAAVELDHYLVMSIVNQMTMGLMFGRMDGRPDPSTLIELLDFADTKMSANWNDHGKARVINILETGQIVAGFITLPPDKP